MAAKDIDKLSKKSYHNGHRERLRNKLDKDPEMETLLDYETLEIILSFVIPRKDTKDIAHELIEKFGSLDSVLNAEPKELIKIKNMTVGASYLLTSMYPSVRKAMRSSSEKDKSKLSKPEDCIEYMHSYFIGRHSECFCLSLLDINYKNLKTFFNSGFSAGAIAVDTGDIVLKASREGASYAVIAHNHPSGNVTPSFDDIEMTKKLYEALSAVDVELIDHIIYSSEYDFFSFHNNGLIQTIAKDYTKKINKTFNETSEDRRMFVAQLNEYIIDVGRLNGERIDTIRKGSFVENIKGSMKKR